MWYWSRVNAFNDHKLLMLSQHLSHMNMVGIYLSHKLIDGPSHMPKHSRIGQEVQIHGLDWATCTGAEFPRPYNFSFWSCFPLKLWQQPYFLPTNRSLHIKFSKTRWQYRKLVIAKTLTLLQYLCQFSLCLLQS